LRVDRFLSRHLLLLVSLLCWASPLSAGSARVQPDALAACRPASHLADPWPILAVHGISRRATDRSVEPFTLALMQAAALWRGRGETGAARAAVVEMARWAHDDALDGDDETSARTARAGAVRRRALAGFLGAWLDLRTSPAGRGEAGLIEPWLARLVAREEVARLDDAHPEADDLLPAVIDAQWALVSGRADLARRAHAAGRATLAEMRPDGSLPRDMARGLRALAGQRRSVAALVYLGELLAEADPSGALDLWASRADGADLHRAVAFLADAIERPGVLAFHVDAPAVRYQDRGFLKVRGNGRHDLAWVELYRARFPDRPEIAALTRHLPRPGDPGWPLVDELAGGNTTCRVHQARRLA
jgi:poly(beta-D-mannuronate) lyase